MHNLPYELAEDILRRLPVKSLKRLRSVEKSWCSLIDSERFVKLHLKWSLDTNSHQRLILNCCTCVFQIDLDNRDKAYLVKSPFGFIKHYSISDPCNGLVLVGREPPVLWNPFTRDYKVLPRIRGYDDISQYRILIAYGLGYDSLSDDYKVVRVIRILTGEKSPRAEVYGLKSNNWTEVKEFPVDCFKEFHAPVNGALHTLVENKVVDATNGCRYEIAAFNLGTNKNYRLKLPNNIVITLLPCFRLNLLGGCLSIANHNLVELSEEIWVMKEYGVTESWEKILTISLRDLRPYCAISSLIPLVYSKNDGKVLLDFNSVIFWYDLREKTMENFPVEGLSSLFISKACVESLVSLNGDDNEPAEV